MTAYFDADVVTDPFTLRDQVEPIACCPILDKGKVIECADDTMHMTRHAWA